MSATRNTSATTVAPLVAVETDIALPSPFIVPPRVRDASGASVSARRPSVRDEKLRRWLMAGDFVAVAIAATLQAVATGFAEQVALLAMAIPLWLIVAVASDLYRTTAWRWDHAGLEELASIVAITAQWGLSALVLGWITGMLSEVNDRPARRGLARDRHDRVPRPRRCALPRAAGALVPGDAIVLGPAEDAERVVSRLLRQRKFGINVMACVEPSTSHCAPRRGGRGPRRRAPPASAPCRRARRARAARARRPLDLDRVIIAGPLALRPAAGFVTRPPADVHIDLVPDWGELVSARLEVRHLAGVPLLSAPTVSSTPRRCASSAPSTRSSARSRRWCLLSPVLSPARSRSGSTRRARSCSASAASARTSGASRS